MLFSTSWTDFGSASYRGTWGVFSNPAGLSVKGRFGGMLAFESVYLVKGLGRRYAGLAFSGRAFSTGIGYKEYGMHNYVCRSANIAYSRTFEQGLFLGLSLYYLHNAFGEKNKSHDATFAAGMQKQFNSRFSVAVLLFNPWPTISSFSSEVDGQSLSKLGFRWKLNREFSMFLDIGWNHVSNPDISMALLYSISKKFRAGLAITSSSISFGCGFNISKFSAEFSNGFHPRLGSSPSVALQIHGNSQKQ